jgi:hypothetical protein
MTDETLKPGKKALAADVDRVGGDKLYAFGNDLLSKNIYPGFFSPVKAWVWALYKTNHQLEDQSITSDGIATINNLWNACKQECGIDV